MYWFGLEGFEKKGIHTKASEFSNFCGLENPEEKTVYIKTPKVSNFSGLESSKKWIQHLSLVGNRNGDPAVHTWLAICRHSCLTTWSAVAPLTTMVRAFLPWWLIPMLPKMTFSGARGVGGPELSERRGVSIANAKAESDDAILEANLIQTAAGHATHTFNSLVQ